MVGKIVRFIVMELSVVQLVHKIAHILYKEYKDEHLSLQYAWWTLEGVTNTTKAELLALKSIVLSYHQQQCIDEWIKKQVDDHMPIAYLLGSVSFCNATIQVTPPILIPRPETEAWCSWLISLVAYRQAPLAVLDLCTGSGCVAIALARALPNAYIDAVDINAQAVALARHNVQLNNLATVTVIESDLFTEVPHKKYDIIVANPPYIRASEWDHMDASVTLWEDKKALVADDEGIAIIKRIIDSAPAYLRDTVQEAPQLLIEVADYNAERVLAYMDEHGMVDCAIWYDYAEKKRLVYGKKA